jgi:DNA-binding transcriptional ArsR family regulator
MFGFDPYSDDVPGAFIYDPLARQSRANAASTGFSSDERPPEALAVDLDFSRAGLAGQSVTIECFVKPDASARGDARNAVVPLDALAEADYHFDVSASDDSEMSFAVRELLAVMKALADPSRLRIVAALDGRELCLCQIVELVGLATSTVSRHMSILERARLVDARKDGRWTYFRLAGEQGRPEASDAAALVFRALAQDALVRADSARLKQILKVNPEQLCRQQSECKC